MSLFFRLSCALLVVGLLFPTPSRAASPVASGASPASSAASASSALSAFDVSSGVSFQYYGKKKGDDPKRPKPKPGPRDGGDDD